MNLIKLHDTIAILEDVKTYQLMTDNPILLPKGQVGTVVEIYNDGEAYEVECSDENGKTIFVIASSGSTGCIIREISACRDEVFFCF